MLFEELEHLKLKTSVFPAMITESFPQQGTTGHITGDQETAEEEDALLQTLQTLHLTHREVVRLFMTEPRQGATDAQIADALRHGLPHLDPDCFQEGMHAE